MNASRTFWRRQDALKIERRQAFRVIARRRIVYCMTVTAHRPTYRTNENINTLRFRAGLSQSALGRLVGLGSGTMSRKMQGQADWTLSEARALADALHVSLDELTGPLPDFEEWSARVVRQQGLEPRTR